MDYKKFVRFLIFCGVASPCGVARDCPSSSPFSAFVIMRRPRPEMVSVNTIEKILNCIWWLNLQRSKHQTKRQ